MPKTDKELNRIIREAERVLRASAKPASKTNVHVSPEIMRLAKKMSAYKELTKKKRLSLDEKRALLSYTPKQVARERNLSQKSYQKRLDAFRKLTGREIEPGEYARLRYLTPKQLIRNDNTAIADAQKEESATDNFPDIFTPVEFPTNIRWWDIPESLRRSATERRSRGILYENQEYFWNNPESIKLGAFFFAGVNGISQTVIGAARQILVATGNTNILIDPKDSGARFAVYKEEWDNVEELSPDYTESRAYRKKK